MGWRCSTLYIKIGLTKANDIREFRFCCLGIACQFEQIKRRIGIIVIPIVLSYTINAKLFLLSTILEVVNLNYTSNFIFKGTIFSQHILNSK